MWLQALPNTQHEMQILSSEGASIYLKRMEDGWVSKAREKAFSTFLSSRCNFIYMKCIAFHDKQQRYILWREKEKQTTFVILLECIIYGCFIISNSILNIK